MVLKFCNALKVLEENQHNYQLLHHHNDSKTCLIREDIATGELLANKLIDF